jgi:hypothetical protein
MLQKILQKYYQFQPWQEACKRFKKLQYLDAWLDGEFYSAIPTSFADEEDGSGRYISIHDRRPAVQHNLPGHIADLCARKLFGGRHAPRIRHKDNKKRLAVQAFIEETGLISKMMETVKRGSVGSVLVMFRMRKVKGQDKPQSVVEITKARVVTPVFDSYNQLEEVRIHYPIPGWQVPSFFEVDAEGKPIKSSNKYWFIRHVNDKEDCLYYPIIEQKWNPVEGYSNPKMTQFLKEGAKANNPLGFLPAVWIQNQTGGEFPDGKSTFESALNNFIEYDYMSSQTGRGLFYHASPQLVIKGNIKGSDDDPDATQRSKGQITGPAHTLMLEADEKNGVGGDLSGHDAKLLDTNAQGLSTAIDFASKLKHTSLEQVSAVRKDLESIEGSMSGKAMELIDQDFLDLIEELRVQYCDKGYLCLLKKMLKAAKIMGHPLLEGISEKDIDGLSLQYPPYSTPEPQEFLFIVQALTAATGQADKPAAGGADGAAPAGPKVKPLLTPEEATYYLKTVMDFFMDSEDQPTINETEEDEKETEEEPLPQPGSADPANGEEAGPDVLDEYPKSNTYVPIIDVPF